jgi:mono/diheme cytochrome c family protein
METLIAKTGGRDHLDFGGEFKMTKPAVKWLLVATMIVGYSAAGRAQGIDAGKTAYLSSCAACHGEDAKGNGVLSPVLKVPPADLTTLARRNDGVFPIAAVNEIIDGRTLIAAHGTREMPIWGFDVMVRNRIAEIIDYLNRIQRK